MRKLLLTFAIISFGFKMYAQEMDFGIPQKPIKPVVSVPTFLDSARLNNDIMKLDVLKNIYRKLKKEGVGAVYQHSFYVDTDGNTILLMSEKKKFLTPINKYVKSIFVNYRWKPGYKLGCQDCLVKCFGVLSFDFNTDDNYIICTVRIDNEKEYKVFNEKIRMK